MMTFKITTTAHQTSIAVTTNTHLHVMKAMVVINFNYVSNGILGLLACKTEELLNVFQF